MRVELILEAIDRATRTINSVRAAARGVGLAEERAATRTARFERRSQIAVEQAIERTNAARAASVEITRQATVGATAQAAAQAAAAQAVERSTVATIAQSEATRRAVGAQAAAVAAAVRTRNAAPPAIPAPPVVPVPPIPPRPAAGPPRPGVVGGVVDRVRQIGQNYSSAGVQERIAAARTEAAQRQAEAQSNLMGAIGTAAAVGAPVAAAVQQWNTYEDALTDIGLKANLTGERLHQLGNRIRAQARALNTSSVEMLNGMNELAAGGLNLEVAETTLPAIIRAARATKAEVSDLAKSVVTLVNNVGVPAAEVQRALDVMAAAGKEGQFELNDMARHFPRLGAQYAAMGQTGVRAVADLSAALQVMRGQTGTAGEAATNLRDLLNKMTSGPAVKKFQEAGIDVVARMREAQRTGRVFETIHDILKQVTGGDASKLNEIFQEVNSRQGAQALLQEWEKFLRIREQALAANGTVLQDFLVRMGLGVEQARALTVAMGELGTSIGQILAPISNEKAKQLTQIVWAIKAWAEANPELVRTIATVATAAAALFVVLAVIGLIGAVVRSAGIALLGMAGGLVTIAKAVWWLLGPVRMLASFLGGLASGIAGGVAAAGGWAAALALLGGRLLRLGGFILRVAGWLTGITPVFRALAAAGPWLFSALMLASRGFLMLGAAIMTTPIGWIIAGIAAIAAGAYLIYQNWAQIGPLLASAWSSLVASLQGMWSRFTGWLSSVATQAGDIIKAGLHDVFVKLPAWIGGQLSALWESIAGYANAGMASLGNAISQKWAEITRSVGQVAGDLWAKVPELNWGNVIKVLDWASWILPIRWLELIPGFPGWSALIPTIDWRSWFNFSWRDVLPKWNWADIVPRMPNWRSWFSGSGEAAASEAVEATNRIQAAARGPTVPTGVGGVASAAASLEASASTIASIGAKAAEVQSMIQAIPAAATAAVSAAGATLSAANFYSHGVSMMETLAAGIRAGAASAVAAARQTVQQIRDHLPHSPAKVGPLSDLDRVQFGQTLAAAIEAGSPRAIMAARAMAAGLAAAVPASLAAPAMAVPAAPTFAQAPAESARSGQGGGGGASGPISVSLTLSPSFAGTSSGDFVEQLRQALPSIGHELAEAIQREMARRERTEH